MMPLTLMYFILLTLFIYTEEVVSLQIVQPKPCLPMCVYIIDLLIHWGQSKVSRQHDFLIYNYCFLRLRIWAKKHLLS